MKYKYILCDADDTLLNFAAAEKQAFKESCYELVGEYSDEIYEKYHEINDAHWKKLELGLTTREKLKIERFEELFRSTRLLSPECAGAFAACYIEKLSHQSQLFPGAVDTLSKLADNYDIYIITNGSTSVQHGRLDNSPIMNYVKNVFISEEIGLSKPSKDFFNYVISAVGDNNTAAYLVVGDSPSSDIKGAVNSGLDSCLVTNGKEYSVCGQTYTVRDITDLVGLLI